MAKLTLTDPTTNFQSTSQISVNNTLIEAAIENTLSRDGTTPNMMNASLDMNGYSIINASNATITASDLGNTVFATTAAELKTYLESAGTGTVIVSSSITMAANITAATGRHLIIYPVSGGAITTTGYTLALDTLQAGNYQVFNGTGTVTGLTRSNVMWWGALGDGSNDDATAINAASTATTGDVLFPAPSSYYKTASQLTFSSGNRYIGEGMARDLARTQIRPTSAVSVGIYIQHADNTSNGFGFEHISLDMQDMLASSTGLHIDGNWYNDLGDIEVINVAKNVDSNIGILLEGAASFGTYISHFRGVRVDGNDSANTNTNAVGIKLLGTTDARLTSLRLDMVSTNNIYTGILSDYTGAGVIATYLYHNNVTNGWTATNHTGTDNIMVIGGEYNGDGYSFSGHIDVIGGGFGGGGVLLSPGTGARYRGRGLGSISGTQTISAATTITADYEVMKVQSDGGQVTMTANPQIETTNAYNGQTITLKGVSNSNYLTLVNGNGLTLKTSTVNLFLQDSITFVYDTAYTDKWVEIERSRTVELGEDNSDNASSGTGQQALVTQNIAANLMGLTEGIKITAAGTITGTNDAKTVRLRFGSTYYTVINAAAGDTTDWVVEATIVNTAAAAQRISWKGIESDGTVLAGYETATFNTAGVTTTGIYANPSNAGDTVTCTMFKVEKIHR